MSIVTPRGLGIGIPIDDILSGKNAESVTDRIAKVLKETGAQWYQTWTAFNYGGNDKFIPASEDGNTTIADCIDSKGRTLLILNEPERGWNATIASPLDAAMQTTRQLARMWQTNSIFSWCAPNSNINGKNLEWLQAYAQWLWRLGGVVPPYWGIHVYGKQLREINYHWDIFIRWYHKEGHNRPIVITEFGPGNDGTSDEAETILRWVGELLNKETIYGACYFAGGVSYQRHLDLLSYPNLLSVFKRVKAKP